MVDEPKPVIVDMTKAKTLAPLPIEPAYLMGATAFRVEDAKGSGDKKVHLEMTVIEPPMVGETKVEGQKIFDDMSLENEYTLGRLKTWLIGLGYAEKDVNSPKFQIPAEKEVLGRQACVYVRTVIDAKGRYPDKSVAAKINLAEKFAAEESKDKAY